jgi:hypothetical protein
MFYASDFQLVTWGEGLHGTLLKNMRFQVSHEVVLLAGSGGMDNIFTPTRLSRQNSFGSVGTPRTPRFHATPSAGSKEALEATIASLQSDISESKARCASLVSHSTAAEDYSHDAEDIRLLAEKLESMQSLVTRMRTLI